MFSDDPEAFREHLVRGKREFNEPSLLGVKIEVRVVYETEIEVHHQSKPRLPNVFRWHEKQMSTPERKILDGELKREVDRVNNRVVSSVPLDDCFESE